MSTSQIVAFDFDGVICDGRPEYFHSAWLAYQTLWPGDLPEEPTELQADFNALRPLIETGWEMVILLKALQARCSTDKLWEDWPGKVAEVLTSEQLTPAVVIQTLDQVRDRQITTTLSQWLGRHRFYPGMLALLKALLEQADVLPLIITTKEARFVQQLFQHQKLTFPGEQIFGKEQDRSKAEILSQQLTTKTGSVWFIEDRLKTLKACRNYPGLEVIQFFLAGWGYNTPGERAKAKATNITVVDREAWIQRVRQRFKDSSLH